MTQETGKISIKGYMTWQITPIGQNSSSVKCPYGPPAASATRFCGGNFSAGGLWENPDASGCKYKSERTNRLDKLSKVRYMYFRASLERVSRLVLVSLLKK